MAARAVPVFAALGDHTRLALVERLRDRGGLSIAHLTQGLGVSRQAITKHLRVLEDAGVVASTRDGRESRYELQRAGFEPARLCLEHAAAQWDDAIERLKRHIGATSSADALHAASPRHRRREPRRS